MLKKVIVSLILSASILFVQAQENNNATKSADEMSLDGKFSLTKQEALELIKRYKNKRWKRQRRLGFAGRKYDAGSCWFDIKKLTAFQDYVTDRLDKRGGKFSGFRFYYIAYGKNDDHAPEALARLGSTKKIHSLLIVATERIGTEDRDIIEGNRVAAFVLKIENEGTLCPPLPASDCSGATLGNEVYGDQEP